MDVVVAASPVAIGAIVADVVAELSPATIGVATGSSPQSAYAELVRRSAVTPQTGLYVLDEYIGLPAGDDRRFRSTIERQLAGPLGIPAANVFAPDVDHPDLDDAAEEYEHVIRSIGGVDVQICGIGRNGHLAFNEPGSPFDSTTRVVELSAATRADNARFFADADAVPCRAITQGLATILSASCIVLVVIGDAKAAALAACLDGEATTMVPATILQQHPHVVVVADAAAVSMSTFARDHQESAT
jgi:glucosamine-6-phosphate deaminase